MDKHSRCKSTSANCDDVELHLDTLNFTATKINDIENKLLEARNEFQETLTKNTSHLKRIACRLGKCVERARPYYEACERRADILNEIQRTVEVFDKSSADLAVYRKKFEDVQHNVSSTDTRNMEFVNDLIEKINATKKKVFIATSTHEKLLVSFQDVEKEIISMKRQNEMSIRKAQPYFDARLRFNQSLNECKARVEACSQNVSLCKSLYAESMSELENLSEKLHAKQDRSSQSGFMLATRIISSPPNMTSSSPSCVKGPAEVDTPTPTSLSPIRGRGVGAESFEISGDDETANNSHGAYSYYACSPGDPFTHLPTNCQCNSVCISKEVVDNENSRLSATLPLLHTQHSFSTLLLTPSREKYLSSAKRTTSTSTHLSSLQSTATSGSSSLDYTSTVSLTPSQSRVSLAHRRSLSCPSSTEKSLHYVASQPLGQAPAQGKCTSPVDLNLRPEYQSPPERQSACLY